MYYNHGRVKSTRNAGILCNNKNLTFLYDVNTIFRRLRDFFRNFRIFRDNHLWENISNIKHVSFSCRLNKMWTFNEFEWNALYDARVPIGFIQFPHNAEMQTIRWTPKNTPKENNPNKGNCERVEMRDAKRNTLATWKILVGKMEHFRFVSRPWMETLPRTKRRIME